jgi:hypothetical protein
MDAGRYDVIVRSLATITSRRDALAGVFGAALTALLTRIGVEETEAKKKKKGKGKKKNKNAGKNQTSPPVVEPTSPPPPPPPPPPTVGAGFCTYDGTAPGFQGSRRWAQTFFPPQSGQLTGAQFGLRANPADFDLTVEIRTVNAQGAPGNTILATEHINNVTLTSFGAGVIKTVPVTFSPVVPVVLGTPYALVVTGPAATAYAIHTNQGDLCPDGRLFSDSQADGNFETVGGVGGTDLVYSLTVTA